MSVTTDDERKVTERCIITILQSENNFMVLGLGYSSATKKSAEVASSDTQKSFGKCNVVWCACAMAKFFFLVTKKLKAIGQCVLQAKGIIFLLPHSFATL